MATSNARDVQFPGEQPNSLDQQDPLSPKFDEVRHNSNPDLAEIYNEQVSDGSTMVKDDELSHDLRPDPEIAADQDRASFDERWEKERLAAKNEISDAYEDQLSTEDQQSYQSRDDWENSL